MFSKRFDFPLTSRGFGGDWRHSKPGSGSPQPDVPADVPVVSPYSLPARSDEHSANRMTPCYHIWLVDEPRRLTVVADAVNSTWPTIILCNSSRSAQAIARQLRHHGAPATSVHRAQTSRQRRRALTDFIAGHARALVAPNRLAIDLVDSPAAIIHYDPPQDAERLQRTSAPNMTSTPTAVVVILVDPDDVAHTEQAMKDLNIRASFTTFA